VRFVSTRRQGNKVDIQALSGARELLVHVTTRGKIPLEAFLLLQLSRSAAREDAHVLCHPGKTWMQWISANA
jgi:hypothetical protein